MSLKSIVDNLSLDGYTHEHVVLGVRRYFDTKSTQVPITESVSTPKTKKSSRSEFKFTPKSELNKNIIPSLHIRQHLGNAMSPSVKPQVYSISIILESPTKAKECFNGLKLLSSNVIPYTNLRFIIDVGIISDSKENALLILSDAMRKCNCPYYTIQKVI